MNNLNYLDQHMKNINNYELYIDLNCLSKIDILNSKINNKIKFIQNLYSDIQWKLGTLDINQNTIIDNSILPVLFSILSQYDSNTISNRITSITRTNITTFIETLSEVEKLIYKKNEGDRKDNIITMSNIEKV